MYQKFVCIVFNCVIVLYELLRSNNVRCNLLKDFNVRMIIIIVIRL